MDHPGSEHEREMRELSHGAVFKSGQEVRGKEAYWKGREGNQERLGPEGAASGRERSTALNTHHRSEKMRAEKQPLTLATGRSLQLR